MTGYVIQRFASAMLLLLTITAVAYGLIYSGGAEVSRSILGELATDEQVAAKNVELGLDQPLPIQYGNWLANAVRGDLGRSWFSAERVSDAIASRLGVTLSIVSVAILICTVISVALGAFAAVRRGWWDRAVQIVSVIGEALPNFWVGLLLVATFAISLRLFPATGFVPLNRSPLGWLSSITLPVTALVIGGVASAAAQVRGALIDVLSRDYIRTLRARGLPENRVILRHALRNAAPAAITVLSLQFIGMIGGAVMIEKVFALPGMGTLAIDATVRGDIPVIMGVLITMALIVVVVNLFVDLANAWINPKARLA
ncbi:ABC transporter permease [Devosia riboflavina]|uniref:ABC transporter permease n=1 Tax=Devosia riboflavina TaxID=46914 RepID=A0A087M2X8_9HYPH|nr:ABC transporter permease [Devosia riboflavina]KFL31231.1 ABC transporter permease [Devosia riboflavina]